MFKLCMHIFWVIFFFFKNKHICVCSFTSLFCYFVFISDSVVGTYYVEYGATLASKCLVQTWCLCSPKCWTWTFIEVQVWGFGWTWTFIEVQVWGFGWTWTFIEVQVWGFGWTWTSNIVHKVQNQTTASLVVMKMMIKRFESLWILQVIEVTAHFHKNEANQIAQFKRKSRICQSQTRKMIKMTWTYDIV